MGRIYLIKAAALITSVTAKIIALPFIILTRVLQFFVHGIRRALRLTASVFRKIRARRQERRSHRLARREDAAKRKQQRKKEREEKRALKRKRHPSQRRKRTVGKKRIPAIFQKISAKHPKSRTVHVLKRGYWIWAVFAHRAYWVSRTLLQKVYWKFHGLYRRIYWISRTLLQKAYWFFRTLLQKTYWFFHAQFRRVYWFSRTLCQKIYWFFRTLLQRVYWFLRTLLQKVYWNHYYPKSRKLYQNLSKNAYMDLYFVFLRRYLKRSQYRLRFFPIMSGREYVRRHSNDSHCRIVEEGRPRPVCIPAYFEKSAESVEQYPSPDIYIAEIHSASLIGGSNVLTVRNVLLNDAAAHDKEKRIDIRYSCIKNVLNGVAAIEEPVETNPVPAASAATETARPADTVLKEDNRPAEIEKGINLVGAASFNYYHLVVEILSKLTFADYYEEYREYPVLVDEVVLRIPQFRSALDCINKFRHPVIKIEQGKRYLVREMILPSSNVWMPTNVYNRQSIRTSDFLISETVLNNIRNAVNVWQEKAPWRKIFISRKNTQAVRLRNEEQVRNIFAENGFEIVYTEELSFRQQVECFGQAKCVVAASGAALTNTIFCQPGTLIGCIIPAEHRFYMYSTIAYLLGLKTLFLDAEITERTPYAAADAFVLDADYVKRYIKHIGE